MKGVLFLDLICNLPCQPKHALVPTYRSGASEFLLLRCLVRDLQRRKAPGDLSRQVVKTPQAWANGSQLN